MSNWMEAINDTGNSIGCPLCRAKDKRVQELEEALEAIYKDGLKHEAIDCGDHCHNTCVWCEVRAALRK